MGDIRTEKIISIRLMMNKNNFKKSKIINRRISNYNFQENTIITYDDSKIKISTETSIKGVHNVLLLFPNGISKLDFEFN